MISMSELKSVSLLLLGLLSQGLGCGFLKEKGGLIFSSIKKLLTSEKTGILDSELRVLLNFSDMR